jgi:hypothetical protein
VLRRWGLNGFRRCGFRHEPDDTRRRGRLSAKEQQKWGDLIRRAGIKANT